jgi:hypothetical protein
MPAARPAHADAAQPPPAAPGVREARTDGDPRLAGISVTALRAEVRRRAAASRSRDRRANAITPDPGGANGNLQGRYVETLNYLKMVRRMLRGARRRVGDAGDIDSLAELAAIAADADAALREAVTALRAADPPFSWQAIGVALGYPAANARQSAYTKYSDPRFNKPR